MKKTLLTATLFLLISTSFAQVAKVRQSTFSIGGEAAHFFTKSRYNKGVHFGGSLQQEFLVNKTGITINLGYSYPHDYYNIEHQLWLMPGVRYYFTKNLFTAAQLGPSLVAGNDWAGIGFTYSLGVGVKFKPVDVSLYYRGTLISTESFPVVGARAAIAF